MRRKKNKRCLVACLAAVEMVNPDMPCTLDACALVQMNQRGQIKNCIVDGPLALDNAIDETAVLMARPESLGSGRRGSECPCLSSQA